MPHGSHEPIGQKRLTNIAVVRHKAHGKRFEIACYKNKVLNWRDGIEKDLEEVIQTDTVFENVSKGVWAKDKDLVKVFGTDNKEECCKIILKCGELQVSDREREVQMENMFRDVVQLVGERIIHAQTGRKHTPAAVENALKSVGFSLQPDQTAKKQSLKAIELLCKELSDSFARAQMRLRIVCAEKLVEDVKTFVVDESKATIEEQRADGSSCVLTFMCDPRHYRDLDKLVTVKYASEEISLQIVEAAVIAEVNAAEVLAGAGGMHGLTVVASAGQCAQCPAAPEGGGYSAAKAPVAVAAPGRSGPRCSACAASFDDAAEYRVHCKSAWHNFNLKRKVKSLPPVTEEDYQEVALDVKEGFLGVDN